MSFGFPHDLTRTTYKNEIVAYTYLEWSEIVPNRDLDDFDPALHFLVPFGENYPEAHPMGMSGSAKWFRKGSTPEVWHPNIDIAGVTITFHPKERLTKNVRREAVEGFLTTYVGSPTTA